MGVGISQFTEPARQVLALAHREAVMSGHQEISQEHILLALIQDIGPTGKLLREEGANIETVRQIVNKLSSLTKKKKAKGGNITLDESTKRVLEKAVEIARIHGQNFITPEHLLLAVVMQPETRINDIFKESGLNQDRIRATTELLIQKSMGVQELAGLLETLKICSDLLSSDANSIHQAHLRRIEQILGEYFRQGGADV